MPRLATAELRCLSAAELERLAIAGDHRSLRELNRRQVEGDSESARAGDAVVLASRSGSRGARRSIRVCNREGVRKLNRAFESGQLPIERDTGHGFETQTDWSARRPSCGRAPRAASSRRTRGSRRQSASRGSPRGDPDDGESEPPGLEPALQEADSGKGLHSVSAVAPTATAERIAVVLADAGNDRWGLPKGSTYRELAQLVYGTEEPTTAQLSAARRAGARLLRSGQASKSRRGTAGVELRRLETAEDRELRAAARRPIVERQEARRRATPYAIDTGSEIVEVPIEPVLMITPTGVELRDPQTEPTQNAQPGWPTFQARGSGA